MVAMLGADAARKEAGEQVIGLDAVIEGVDQPFESLRSTRPLVERLGHLPSV
jgi:hypothetical protein